MCCCSLQEGLLGPAGECGTPAVQVGGGRNEDGRVGMRVGGVGMRMGGVGIMIDGWLKVTIPFYN